MTTSLRISPGINDQVFETLKQKVSTWKERKKYCSIIFDEISLPSGLNFDKTSDVINGFVQHIKTNKFADHVLIFMIRGSILEWHQPIAFYFTEGTINSNELKIILKQITAAVVETGLVPVVLICDEKASFQSAIESLTEDTNREHEKPNGVILLSGQDLSVIYDPFRLLKGIRNAFVSKNIMDDGNISKWDDIVEVYKIQRNLKKNRVLPKLRDRHVLPHKIDMKQVHTSIPVLSNKVAGVLAFTSQFGNFKNGEFISRTLLNTSKTVCFFDKLLDACNGSALRTLKRKELRQAVTIYSQHHTNFWKEAIDKLENIQFVNKESDEVIVVPTLKNWLVTVKSLQRLWDFFKWKKITAYRPAYFNCIPIDDFFKQMRQNYRKVYSGCHNFITTFKSLLIEEIDSKNEFERDRIFVHSRAYVVGWLVKKISNKIKCDICQNNLTTEQGCGGFREYKLFQDNELTHPSKHAMRYFGIIEKETYKFLDKKPNENNISMKIRDTLLRKYSFDCLTCDEHKTFITRYFVIFIIRFTISKWCNVINKTLNGKTVLSLSNVNSLSSMLRKAVKKYRKRLKNKEIEIYLLLLFIIIQNNNRGTEDPTHKIMYIYSKINE